MKQYWQIQHVMHKSCVMCILCWTVHSKLSAVCQKKNLDENHVLSQATGETEKIWVHFLEIKIIIWKVIKAFEPS